MGSNGGGKVFIVIVCIKRKRLKFGGYMGVQRGMKMLDFKGTALKLYGMLD